ncbi:MAG: hypothetical protein EBS85_06310, partial [Micrococcales bacterium]|nr:hypothetical protein [Micrococcales bacterium]
TLGVGAVTGFLAFWGRKFSVMLVNFMATFSSAMQMFSMLIIGDMLYEFAWDSAPAWWWSIVLVVVSALAFVLARFKANFGWKIISIASLLGSAFALILGPLSDLNQTGSPTFGWQAAACTVAAVLLALVTKTVTGYQYSVPKDSQDAEYEKDLGAREDAALKRFAPVPSGMLLGWGLGYVLFGLVSNLVIGIEPLSFTAFALVWVAAGAFQEKWITVLATTKAVQEKLNFWQHIVGFASLALALSSWIAFISQRDLWIGVIGSSVLFFASAVLVTKVKRVAAHPIAIMVSQFAVLASWLFWYEPVQQTSMVALPAISALLLMFGLSLTLEHSLRFSVRALNTAIVANTLGVLILAINMRINQADLSSIGYSVTTLGMIVLAVAYSPLLALIGAKHKQEPSNAYHQLVLAFTAVTTLVLVFPLGAITDISSYLNLILLAFLTAAATGLVAVTAKKLPGALKSLLRSYGYVFQGAVGLLLIFSAAYSDNAAVIAICIAGLALLNYALAWLGKSRFEGWLGYALALVSLLMALTAQLPYWQISAHLALAIGASLVIAVAHNLVTKRSGLGSVPYVSYAVCFAFALASYLMNFDSWRNGQSTDQVWIGLGEVLAIAIGGAVLAERKGTKSESALRINSLAYLVFGFFGFANVEFISLLMLGEQRTTSPYLREMIVAFVFAVIAIRQLAKVSRAENSALTNGWFALSYLAPVTVALLASDLLRSAVNLDKFNLELVTIPLAIAIALPAIFNSALPSSLKRLIGLDVPLLFPVAASAIYSLSQDVNEATTMYRLVASTAILAGYSFWRFGKSQTLLWAVLEYAGLLGLGLSLAQLVEVLAPNLLEGPELFGVGAS